MKIAFTGTIFYNQKFGGISRYFSEIVQNMDAKTKIIAPINKNIYLKNISPEKKNSFFFKKVPHFLFLKKINNSFMNQIIKKFDPDIIHETYYSENVKNLNNFKKVITIYDLIHEKYNDIFYKNKLSEKQNILNYIDHFICISEQTKKDFLNYYNVPSEKVSVVYLGGNHLNKCNSFKSRIINEPYILYIGSREKYKNFKIFYKALKKIKTKTISLVCFGGEKFNKYELSNNDSNIKIKQIYGDDLILSNLIQNAECFVNTSVYEGFSIPNLEAMSNNCPVVCSKIPVFKEICGEAALYFDKNNSEELAYQIDKIISENDVKNNLIQKGKLRSNNFTWENCSKNTLEIYKSILKE